MRQDSNRYENGSRIRTIMDGGGECHLIGITQYTYIYEEFFFSRNRNI